MFLLGCPFIHPVHFLEETFSWTHPGPHESHLQAYVIPDKPHKTRYRCKTCGAGIAGYNSIAKKWSIWGVHLERDSGGKIQDWDAVKPTAHIFYDTRVLDIVDGLGKWDGYENKSNQIA